MLEPRVVVAEVHAAPAEVQTLVLVGGQILQAGRRARVRHPAPQLDEQVAFAGTR